MSSGTDKFEDAENIASPATFIQSMKKMMTLKLVASGG